MICQRMPSFDTSPVVYWVAVYALCWVLLWLAARQPLAHRLTSNTAFVLLTLGLLFFLRLPTIVYDREINPDESQMVSQGMTLRQDPVYFRSVDGTTGGPLNSYLLVLPSFLGLPFDYITAHLMAFGLVALNLLLLFFTAQRWFGDQAARLSLLAAVLMLGLTQNSDLLHYNSELVAVALLSGSYYMLARLLDQPRPSAGLLAGLGLVLGMVPFGKLQGVPLVAVVGLFAGLAVLFRTRLTVGRKMAGLGALAVGTLAFPVLFTVLMWQNGMYNDFITFYILANFQYGAGISVGQSLLSLPGYIEKGNELDWFVKLTLGVWLVAGVFALRRQIGAGAARQSSFRLAFLSALTIAALYAVTRTGYEYVHYLFFLIGPLVLWLAWGLSVLKAQQTDNKRVIWMPTGLVAAFLLCFFIKTAGLYARGAIVNHYPTDQQRGWRMPLEPVSGTVLQYARPGEKLAVWGWRCDYYVQTQMTQGVAENHTLRSVYNHPLRDAYQRRYLANMVRSFPPVFVDAVGDHDQWLTDRKRQGHEVYPPLGRFIAAHYQCIGLVDDTRIYVRNDRIGGLPGAHLATRLSKKKYVD